MLIGGYKSGSDKSAKVSFGRASPTGTGDSLPAGQEYEHPAQHVDATLKDLPASGAEVRIGAFFCEALKDGEVERINTIIMAETSKQFHT